ncbi:MAG: biliverdin-producing heme oxygenase [Hyphomicrobiales bacterium]
MKDRTSEAHARIDALFGRLSLTERDGYGHFLAAHAAAMTGVEALIATAAPDCGWPGGMADLASADLADLDLPAPEPMALDPASISDIDGAIYVVAGSNLGNQVLRRRWQQSTDPKVLRAGRYLSSQRVKSFWPGFVTRLDERAPDPVAQVRLIASALATFSHFEAAFAATQSRLAA